MQLSYVNKPSLIQDLKDTKYALLSYEDNRSLLFSFHIWSGLRARIDIDALQFSIYKNLKISICELDLKYFTKAISDKVTPSKFRIQILNNV